jgi:hypothetical protein
MTTTPQQHRILSRLQGAAKREQADLFKSMPKEFAERIAGVSIRFEGEPSKAMLERGVDADAFSTTQDGANGKEVVVFVMNLFKQYGAEPGAFRRELRRTLLTGGYGGRRAGAWRLMQDRLRSD